MEGKTMETHRQTDERGFVSLFTVVFFMLLITIITVGFLRIMAAEQRQALDNDLTASAEAAAQSGIEDAKRAILKYNALPSSDPLKAQLLTALTSPDCNALFTNASVRTALNLNNTGSINNQPGLNQYYTCLSVNLNTPDYIGSASAGKSDFIPLVPQNGDRFDQIQVSWHLASQTVGTDGDGQPSNYAPGVLLPPVTGANSWSTRGYPAYLRVELYGYPNGNFNRGGMDQLSHSVFLVPNASTNAAAVSSTTPIVLDTVDPRGFDQTKLNLVGIRCSGTPPNIPSGTYACSAQLQIPNGQPSTSHTYFLRVTPQYGSAHFRVQMLRSASTVVNFSGVEPVIDSTGRASDVFRRIQTRVRSDNTSNLPEYAAETANTICKNMQVSDGSYYVANTCP
jgi:Tfp pilus assembly protein PilX